MSWFAVMHRGAQYMELWPEGTVLTAIYEEVRYKAWMKGAKLLFPPMIAGLLLWIYFNCGGLAGLYLLFTRPSAGSMMLYMSVIGLFLMILVLLLIIVHGYLWFGYRADKALTPKQKLYYDELMRKMEKTPVEHPTMFDFISAINTGLKHFKDRSFLDSL